MAYNQMDINLLREWTPLTDLLNKLPIKCQSGLFTQDVKLTCVDIVSDFIAIGTNVGVVYWFNRKTKDLQRLRCETSNEPITVVKVISSVDYMVASGNNLGFISIFQIPKCHPDSLPENLKPQKQQIERYTVSELHKSAITALEWSKNGMKLFSGDKIGCIVLTEIDFYMHICKSLEIINETYEVVQLSYCQQNLLVSTNYRSIICKKNDKWKVNQVGKKDRKALGSFGGTIIQNGFKPTDVTLYCVRPGLRIWIADIEGNVQKTLLFKDLLNKMCPEVPIINPVPQNLRTTKPQKEPSFGILLPFAGHLLVTYSNDKLYVLDPEQMSVLAKVSYLRGILCVATHKDEIFILEEERSLIRIAFRHDSLEKQSHKSTDTSFLPIKSIQNITNKIQSTIILPATLHLMENTFTTPSVNVHIDDSLIVNAEEAIESPERKEVRENVRKKFDHIGKQEFNDKILFKKYNRKKTNSIMTASTSSLSSSSSEEKDFSFVRPTLMNLSSVGILPDLRSPESIKNDIEYKEKILADILNLGKVQINLDALAGDFNSDNNKKEESLDDKLDSHKDKYPHNISDCNESKKLFSEKYVSDVAEIQNNVVHKLPPSSSNFRLETDAPALVSIPNDWKLTGIKLRDRNDSTLSDSSLNDWEII